MSKRRRPLGSDERAPRRPRMKHSDSSDEDDDHDLQTVLAELGIPQNRPKAPASTTLQTEIIELTTPSPKAQQVAISRTTQSIPISILDISNDKSDLEIEPERELSQNANDTSIVDLTESPEQVVQHSVPSSRPNPTSVKNLQRLNDDSVVISDSDGTTDTSRATDTSSTTTSACASSTAICRYTSADTNTSYHPQTYNSPSKSRLKACPSVSISVESTFLKSSTGSAIQEGLKNHIYNNKKLSYTLSSFSNATPGLLRWQRKWSQASPSRKQKKSSLSIGIHMTAERFLPFISSNNYSDIVNTVNRWKDAGWGASKDEQAIAFFILQGLDDALIQYRRNDASTMTFRDVQSLCFQLHKDTRIHFCFTNDSKETGEQVALITREISIAAADVSTEEAALDSIRRLTSFRIMPSGAVDNDSANTWLHMLQMIPGVSEAKAQLIVNHFPTVSSLMEKYEDVRMSAKQKEELLLDYITDGSIGKVISRRVFRVFTIDDPNAAT